MGTLAGGWRRAARQAIRSARRLQRDPKTALFDSRANSHSKWESPRCRVPRARIVRGSTNSSLPLAYTSAIGALFEILDRLGTKHTCAMTVAPCSFASFRKRNTTGSTRLNGTTGTTIEHEGWRCFEATGCSAASRVGCWCSRPTEIDSWLLVCRSGDCYNPAAARADYDPIASRVVEQSVVGASRERQPCATMRGLGGCSEFCGRCRLCRFQRLSRCGKWLWRRERG